MTVFRPRALRVLLGAVGVAVALVVPAARQAAGQDRPLQRVPPGIYSLGPGRAAVPQAILEHPHVRGVVLRIGWRDIEPVEGRFDWTYFDREIPRAVAAGKVVALRIIAGGRNTPDWLLRLGGIQTFAFRDPNPYHRKTHDKSVVIPVFWDPVFLERKRRLLEAWGRHGAANPAVVTVNAPCANASTGDWSVPADTGEDVRAWRRLGYSPDRLVQACKDTVAAAAAAFPDRVVVLSIGQTQLDEDPGALATTVVDWAYAAFPGRFMAMKSTLSARTPDPTRRRPNHVWATLARHRPWTGAQMLWFVTGDDTFRMNGRKPAAPADVLRTAIRTGVNYGMRFLEVYQEDLLNPGLAEVVRRGAADLETPQPR